MAQMGQFKGWELRRGFGQAGCSYGWMGDGVLKQCIILKGRVIVDLCLYVYTNKYAY